MVRRVLAALETLALGLWLGALCGFAFLFAPTAFGIVTDLGQFAALTAANLRALADLGLGCGLVALIGAILRARNAGDRTNDFARFVLIAGALGLIGYEMYAIVPAMAALPDLRSPAYHALHQRSSAVYGAAVLCIAAALVLAAVRADD